MSTGYSGMGIKYKLGFILKFNLLSNDKTEPNLQPTYVDIFYNLLLLKINILLDENFGYLICDIIIMCTFINNFRYFLKNKIQRCYTFKNFTILSKIQNIKVF